MSQEPLPFEDTIPLSDAETLTTNWRNFIQPLTRSKGSYIRAFKIPIVDITELASYHNAKAVRAYIGLEVADDPSTAKIVIVPIDDNDKDITGIAMVDGGKMSKQQSTIYDMTQPCPQACDTSSPLYES